MRAQPEGSEPVEAQDLQLTAGPLCGLNTVLSDISDALTSSIIHCEKSLLFGAALRNISPTQDCISSGGCIP
jgi:hypothetical protein